MMVSFGGERMIGNLPFSLFNGKEEKKKGKTKSHLSLKKERRDERESMQNLGHDIFMSSPSFLPMA